MNKRRSEIRIYLDMLYSIKKRGGKAKPTHILYSANLSHIRMKKYLDFLLKKGFIQEVIEGERVFYSITEKGEHFIREFGRIETLSEAFGVSF